MGAVLNNMAICGGTNSVNFKLSTYIFRSYIPIITGSIIFIGLECTEMVAYKYFLVCPRVFSPFQFLFVTSCFLLSVPARLEPNVTKPNIAWHYTALHCTALHNIALHCTALHCIVLYYTAQNCTPLYCTKLHCMALN